MYFEAIDQHRKENIMGKRLIKTDITEQTGKIKNEEEQTSVPVNIRPEDFNGYIGQEKVKEQVLTAVKSAIIRNAPVEHILFYGPPGLGKTTLAHIVANVRKSNLKEITGPMIEHPGEMAAILSGLQPGDVLFIDEIHRLDKKVEESLYSAMEDGKINVVIGQGEQCKSLTIDLPPITIIGATTRAGMLSAPLRDRFGLTCKMEYYSAEELAQIGKITAEKLGVSIKDEDILRIAEVSRGTPRVMNSNIRLIRDYATANSIVDVTTEVVMAAMELYGIHDKGLTDIDIRILDMLAEAEKPVGLLTLSHVLGEDEGTIENVYEPYLLMNHYIEKTSRGRIITEKGKETAYSLNCVV